MDYQAQMFHPKNTMSSQTKYVEVTHAVIINHQLNYYFI